jgi:hypothetical protein
MRYSTQIKPISYLKANAAEVLQELTDRRQPMVITQNGEAKAVALLVVPAITMVACVRIPRTATARVANEVFAIR